MTIAPLSRLGDWELVHEEQDIRGKTLMGPDGRPMGTVDEMFVDTEQERVVAIRLDNGREIPASDFQIRDGMPVMLETTTHTRREMPEREMAAERDTMQLREEELTVQKRPVKTGEVELHKEVVSEPRTMEVPVSQEEVVVERHPVEQRPAKEPIGEGETIEIPIHRERAAAEKETVVTEEVEVGKRRVQDTERVSGTVRKEVLDVDKEGDVEVERRDRDRKAS